MEGQSALIVALNRRQKQFVRLLLQAVVAGRVLTLPTALEPLRECFEDIAHVHPKAFCQLIRDMPLDDEPEVPPAPSPRNSPLLPSHLIPSSPPVP
jgi:hypothetical protein